MSPWQAARPGDHISAIDTPALILDLFAFERNLARMAVALHGSGVRLRAHAKSHKCPQIALRQVALGAVGICCQKVSEAAVFVEAGIKDVLVTNEVMGDAKLRHLVALARIARIGVLVDHPQQVKALATAAQAHAVTLDVYVEINVGANRCGVAPERRRCSWRGRSRPARRYVLQACSATTAIGSAVEAARMTREAMDVCGITVERVPGAGTGSLVHERDSGVFNEIQAGSYIFIDRDYGDNERGEGDIAFEHALFVRSTVMSRTTDTHAVVDAGLKASSVDSGMPTVWQRADLRYVKAADEHGVLSTADAIALGLGDQLMLVPGHCAPTVNLYDELVCVRGERGRPSGRLQRAAHCCESGRCSRLFCKGGQQERIGNWTVNATKLNKVPKRSVQQWPSQI